MKHLTTLLTMAITFTGLGQQMPYNPDANGDDFVGVDDVLGVLGVYDTALMQPDLQCDYEGTEFENLVVGFIDGSIVLDSIYVEYLLLDTLIYFTPGCPDEIVEPVVLERAYMLTDQGPSGSPWSQDGWTYYELHTTYFSWPRSFHLSYSEFSNSFEMSLMDNEVSSLLINYSDARWSTPTEGGGAYMLPFPSEFTLDEDGFHCFYAQNSWTAGAEYFRAIPFWHEAE